MASLRTLAGPAAAACAVALVGAGCGSARDASSTAAATQTAAAAVDGGAHVSTTPRQSVAILTPLWGTSVPARRTGRDRVRVKVKVSGSAQPGSRILVSAAKCAADCRSAADARRDGSWSTSLAYTAAAGSSRASVRAQYSEPGPAVGAARVVVNVARPAVAVTQTSVPEGEGPTTVKPSTTAAPISQSAPEAEPPVLTYPAGSGAKGALVLIGDSLSVGQDALLKDLLPGWTVRSSAQVGRHLAVGLQILEAAQLPADGAVIAMGLFTNDDPWATDQLAAGVRESLRRAGPSGCAIWATIASPPVEGQTFANANRLLTQLGDQYPRLRIVPWAQEAQRAGVLGGDGVHPDEAGARLRARLYAQAAKSCV